MPGSDLVKMIKRARENSKRHFAGARRRRFLAAGVVFDFLLDFVRHNPHYCAKRKVRRQTNASRALPFEEESIPIPAAPR